jgi:hypothetical protein
MEERQALVSLRRRSSGFYTTCLNITIVNNGGAVLRFFQEYLPCVVALKLERSALETVLGVKSTLCEKLNTPRGIAIFIL